MSTFGTTTIRNLLKGMYCYLDRPSLTQLLRDQLCVKTIPEKICRSISDYTIFTDFEHAFKNIMTIHCSMFGTYYHAMFSVFFLGYYQYPEYAEIAVKLAYCFNLRSVSDITHWIDDMNDGNSLKFDMIMKLPDT